MFDRIDHESLAALVAGFYGRARRDPRLGPVFEAAVDDWDMHLARLEAFWSSVMLRSGLYKGNPFAAHLKLPITPDLFATWLGLWGQTAEELFTPELAEQFRERAERIAQSLKMGLFEGPR